MIERIYEALDILRPMLTQRGNPDSPTPARRAGGSSLSPVTHRADPRISKRLFRQPHLLIPCANQYPHSWGKILAVVSMKVRISR
jgi:hypothetical protein